LIHIPKGGSLLYHGDYPSRNCEAQILHVKWQCSGEDAVYISTQQQHIIQCTADHTDGFNCTGQFMRTYRVIMNKTCYTRGEIVVAVYFK
jgi:hypothetical protein